MRAQAILSSQISVICLSSAACKNFPLWRDRKAAFITISEFQKLT
jgi:hypothetical protein